MLGCTYLAKTGKSTVFLYADNCWRVKNEGRGVDRHPQAAISRETQEKCASLDIRHLRWYFLIEKVQFNVRLMCPSCQLLQQIYRSLNILLALLRIARRSRVLNPPYSPLGRMTVQELRKCTFPLLYVVQSGLKPIFLPRSVFFRGSSLILEPHL